MARYKIVGGQQFFLDTWKVTVLLSFGLYRCCLEMCCRPTCNPLEGVLRDYLFRSLLWTSVIL